MRKGEENLFCVDCRRRMCSHCQGHAGHTLLQIRKYVYRDVPYTVNGAKVVHLNPRDKSTPSKPNSGGPACRICRQSVCSDLSRYCSVACKLSEEASEEEESGQSDDNAAERSEPSIHDPTSELDENGTDKEADSSLVYSQNQQQQQEQQQQPYDSGEENQGSRKQRRKGVPRRAPEF
ncbi:uncharacterized protein LOC109721079 [Ananas comosus]|uniref:Uncharacterized protein LOC109721079 n=1 Tax=Ananas comosus TaxID=4615 RepID=A0A6P5G8D7_ANACO|nr:uncharacterized protein LOC109721079 [Ananas comosus]